ncbi:MAG: AbrB/MazE/SpoVT family DNA-binding domain-containing protein [Chloroflexi bacterium]|nr:AbrB/MazE/SpoVT family DNA-binding domain-containing protein [Chloroflexota bacterium]MDA8187270.1 AbrB/MazE/SpoVT family DNA-binding domain-containing protein [Dehalococcoidales bacterium]
MPKREYLSRVSPKGQITLPAQVRKELKIKPRDTVAIEMDKGVVKIKPRARLQDFYRKMPALQPPKTWEEIEEIAHEEHAEDVAKEGLR